VEVCGLKKRNKDALGEFILAICTAVFGSTTFNLPKQVVKSEENQRKPRK